MPFISEHKHKKSREKQLKSEPKYKNKKYVSEVLKVDLKCRLLVAQNSELKMKKIERTTERSTEIRLSSEYKSKKKSQKLAEALEVELKHGLLLTINSFPP